ncbi:MAG: hypothetical protein B5766_06055 [Candidatus Lumbricidophila eiseniae]|uniref:FAD-binding FR-type domain-containing protein n=1 Tax=Candidatus Lumbricidiphila eiseniae TaxID=1969409 RepID=A0A2A6FRZ5_9MICO|nr:MAG: hypothetical protein B5766_06055 [Candidatus Lumbricidophila eiseniae]
MLTSLATTSARPRPAYRVFAATAARVVHLGSTFTRVSFTGDDLADFGTAGFDQRIKLVFPHPATGFEDFPRSEDWYQLWRELPAARQNAFRTYTVRHVRPDVREVDVEFALHGDHGPATRWASRVRVGDPILIIGPDERSPDRTVGIDFRPGSVERLLIAGDETAAPAICAILEQVPRNTRGIALIDVPHATDALVVNAPVNMTVRWLARRPGEVSGDQLIPAVRDWVARACCPQGCHSGTTCRIDRALAVARNETAGADAPLGDVPFEDVPLGDAPLWDVPAGRSLDGELYAWLAGESSVITTLRRFLVREAGLDRRQVAFMGYWRRGRAESE